MTSHMASLQHQLFAQYYEYWFEEEKSKENILKKKFHLAMKSIWMVQKQRFQDYILFRLLSSKHIIKLNRKKAAKLQAFDCIKLTVQDV